MDGGDCIMPKYNFQSSETVYYENIIEAESLDAAKEIFYNGYIDFEPIDACNFQLDDIIEEE
jgi:hypothetical protein